jgi:hypothetical protein
MHILSVTWDNTREKGCDRMSKQSNQRYRKEKEKDHLRKAGLSEQASDAGNVIKPRKKGSDADSTDLEDEA